MSKYPSQMQDKFNLRFPDGMRDAIAERAKLNGRSMNSEIIEMLKFAMDRKPTWVGKNEIYVPPDTLLSMESSDLKYPEKEQGLLILEIKQKVDQLNELLHEEVKKTT